METLEDFVARLSKDVGCYYHLLPGGSHPIKRNNTRQRGQMGVFGFVEKGGGRFRIRTFEDAASRAGVIDLFDENSANGIFGSSAAIIFARNGSKGDDYKKAVKALTAIKDLK
jgi:hypothetical protein